ncbi:MAG TPA: hypothetical protein VMS73_04825 [Anaerolineaceae bacterium]|nr:hypothetical protein [Anaerolineaceae bacterium]
MCVFCAAIPITAAIGASVQSSQREKIKQALMNGTKPPKILIPVGPATAVAVSGLVVASIVYHTHYISPI